MAKRHERLEPTIGRAPMTGRLYVDRPRAAPRILRSMSHWPFVLGAYALVFGTLFVYWRGVERAIRTLERGAEDPPARARP